MDSGQSNLCIQQQASTEQQQSAYVRAAAGRTPIDQKQVHLKGKSQGSRGKVCLITLGALTMASGDSDCRKTDSLKATRGGDTCNWMRAKRSFKSLITVSKCTSPGHQQWLCVNNNAGHQNHQVEGGGGGGLGRGVAAGEVTDLCMFRTNGHMTLVAQNGRYC